MKPQRSSSSYESSTDVGAPGTRHPAPGTRHSAPGTPHSALGTPLPALRTPLPRRRLLALAAVGAGAVMVRPAAGARAQSRGVVREVLPNGLTVIVEERPTAATLALNLTTRAGSRDDGAAAGITFLTLRAMFAGTPRRPSTTALLQAAALVGGNVNGSAVAESSAFFTLVPSREADVAFDVLADIVTQPLMDEDTAMRLKQITVQDVARRRADPSGLIGELFTTAMFPGHPLSTPTGGVPEGLEPLTRDALVNHLRRYWVASNSVLAVVGRIRPEDAFARARQYFGEMQTGTANQRPAVPVQPRRSGEPVSGQAGQQQLQFRLAFPAPSLLEADRWPMTVLNAITSNRMFREIRTLRGLAYSAGSSYQGFTDIGAWYAAAGIDPENLESVLDLVRDEVRKLKDEPADTEELTGRIGQLTGGQILADESNADRASRIGSRAILGIPETEEFVQRVRAVTAADIQQVARTYFDLDRSVLVVVSPRAG
jgi:predicted Zn-dependent peptidase